MSGKLKGDLVIKWFARGCGIARSGPYASQVEAVEGMRLMDGGFPKDVFVWPERVAKPKRTPAGARKKRKSEARG